MHDDELDELMNDVFLNSLENADSEDISNKNKHEKPDWVCDEETHTTYLAWKAILALQVDKEKGILAFGKIADKKTPKSLYQIKKSEVARTIGISAQSIFRTSTFSKYVLSYFEIANDHLLQYHDSEQSKQKSRRNNIGIRAKKKSELVDDVHALQKKNKELECRQVKDTLDILLSQMPIDLRRKLRM